MLLTLTLTPDGDWPATDLGYLLHKHPGRVQTFGVAAGAAHVLYPQAAADRCTAALLLEVDPVGLVRGSGARGAGRRDGAIEAFSLGQYVNDRPYAASSLLATALGAVFRTAMAGRCDARPDLAARPLPLEVSVPVLPCRGGADLARRVFAPLGWEVVTTAIPLDETMPAWGDSRYLALTLRGTVRLAEALSHLYVLLPVLDDAKHYWVAPDEVDKLIRAGTGWLAAHPEADLITRRYLAHRRPLTRAALERLAEVDDDPTAVSATAVDGVAAEVDLDEEPPGDRPVPLAEQRKGAVLAVLRAEGARRVADLGCGSGALTAALLDDPAFTEVLAADVSAQALAAAERRLRLDRMPAARRERLRLLQTALTYRDTRLAGLDAVVLMEVIEHVDPWRLEALQRSVFRDAAPRVVVVTTPNAEHNVRFEGLAAGAMRHRDHRFEWTRAQFRAWAGEVAGIHGYAVRYLPVGADDPEVGPPTQLAVFTRSTDGAGGAA